MKYSIIIKILFISFIFSLNCISQIDSNNSSVSISPVNSDIAKENNVNKSSLNWYERNEGTIVGSFFAGVIAIFSVWLTNYLNARAKNKKEIEIYCGLLFAIKTELEYHAITLPNLIDELSVIHTNSKEKQNVLCKPTRFIPCKFLIDIRSKIILQENYHASVFHYVSAYINKCELINADLQLENLNALINNQKDLVDIKLLIDSYFDSIVKGIEEILNCIPNIFIIINTDLSSFGKNDIQAKKNVFTPLS